MEKNATITSTSLTQTANAVLGTEEKTIYYLVVEGNNGKMTINVGKKTHDKVMEITKVVTKIEGVGGNKK